MTRTLRNVSLLFIAAVAAAILAAPVCAYADPALNYTSGSLYTGEKMYLEVNDPDATDDAAASAVSWSSSKESVATVNSNGVVKGVKKGSATITATVGEQKLTCKVKVMNTPTIVILRGGKEPIGIASDTGKLTVKSSNKKVFKVASVSKKKAIVKLKGVKNGTAKLTIKDSKYGKIVYKVKVATGKSYVNKWAKATADRTKEHFSTVKDRVFYASVYVVTEFTKYGYISYSKDLSQVISKKKGTCHSVGLVLAKIYEAMGYKATVRSAVNDNMSRYPSGVYFGSDHYNVKVKAKGKTYYTDATPGNYGGVTYLSTSKKPLRYWCMGYETRY